MVRAKFMLNKVSHTKDGTQVDLHPVTGGCAENEEYFKYTPLGRIEMGILNEAAARQFEEAGPGAEFYVDFTPVETP